MKKAAFIVLMAVLAASCNYEGSSTERKLDSLEERIDTTADKVWDSTKAKAKELKERIEQKLENRDSLKREDTTRQ